MYVYVVSWGRHCSFSLDVGGHHQPSSRQDDAQPLGTNPFENGADDFPEEAPPPAYESVMMSDSLLMSNGVRACTVERILMTR